MGVETTTGPAVATTQDGAPTKTLTLEAPDLDVARTNAAEQFGVPKAEVVVRVVSKHKKGFLGLGGEVLSVEATWTAPPPAIPGRIELSCERGRLSLAVFRPENHGKPPDVAMLEEMLADLQLDARDESIIVSSLHAMDEKPRVFGTISPSAAVPDDAPVAIKIAQDDFRAWLVPWSPTPATKVAVLALLTAAGVTAGVDETVLAKVDGQVVTMPVRVASGRPAVDGVDAYPEFVLETLKVEHAPAVGQDGRVDFRDLGGTPSVKAGDVLVKKAPAVPGIDGFTVKGKKLPAKSPKDFDIRKLLGQNTGLSEDRSALIAKTGGLADRVQEKVVVMPMRSVQGDVDFTTGNVYFEGNLMISGGIKPGFKVQATGNIQIGGTLEAAQVEAGADVTVLGGVVGQNMAVIKAGGAVTARFVEAAEIHAAGPVTVGSEIRQSTVISEKSVTVAGQGRIVGGLVRGRDSVEANVLGSQSGSPTSVQAGWGEEMIVEIGGKPRIPRVQARSEVNPGVTITVGGATQRVTHGGPGGVWRESEGKIQYSAS